MTHPMPSTIQTTEEILTERGARYGLFLTHAHITQQLKQTSNSFLRLRRCQLLLTSKKLLT